MLIHATGITLSRRKVAENDAVALTLLEDGRSLDLRGHGILRSKNRSNLMFEPGCSIRFTAYLAETPAETAADGGRFASLKEGRVLERRERLKSDYNGLLLLALVLEPAERACRALSPLANSPRADPEGEESAAARELYRLTTGALEQMEKISLAAQNARAGELHFLLGFYETRLLNILGLLGDLRHCSSCGRPLGARAAWALPEAHFRCDSCSEAASSEDAWMAALSAASAGTRFGVLENARRSELQSLAEGEGRAVAAVLEEWRRRTHRCLNAFFGAPLRSDREAAPLLARMAEASHFDRTQAAPQKNRASDPQRMDASDPQTGAAFDAKRAAREGRHP